MSGEGSGDNAKDEVNEELNDADHATAKSKL